MPTTRAPASDPAPSAPQPLLRALHDALLARMGPQGWWPADDRFEMMLGAVLVQHTRWENAVLSIGRLREAGLLDPPALAAESPERLVPLLRRSGFMMAKARACIALARWTVREEAEHGLLDHLDDAALRASLLAVTGVGPETADVIALYAFGRGVLIADAYAWRLLVALGHDAPRPYEALRRSLAPHVAEAGLTVPELQELHALVDEFGRLAARDATLVPALRDELDAVGVAPAARG
ncbi:MULTISPECIES: endonuclease III domain-containing protein [unclassified Agrococcus]|uniref:endonuclease III domain-containing protein n=1 Tax=unclassified Agrococcus TaxID=2615065 RepID=UPI003623466A